MTRAAQCARRAWRGAFDGAAHRARAILAPLTTTTTTTATTATARPRSATELTLMLGRPFLTSATRTTRAPITASVSRAAPREHASFSSSSVASHGAKVVDPDTEPVRDHDLQIAHTRTHVTKKLWRERLRKAESGKGATKLSEKLLPKTPQTSTAVYDFQKDEEMREMYKSHGTDAVRMGRILEDLDSLAGNIAFFHADDGDDLTKTPQLVTASVDRVRLNRPLSLERSVVIRGEVAFVGRSSMVIRMEADEEQGTRDDELIGSNIPALTADFTFVARDPETNESWPVNPLICETRAQTARFEDIQASIVRKRLRHKKGDGVLNDELIAHRKKWVHDIRERARLNQEMPALTAGFQEVLTSQTVAENMFVAQPQQRNLSGRVFGGFLLRRAYELAFANCQLFSGGHPVFVEMSDIDFKLPVNIGDLIRFKCKVLHTVNTEEARCGKPSVYLEVRAIVTNPHKVTSAEANTFMFKFNVTGFENENGEIEDVRLKRVLPTSTEEGLLIWDKCIRQRLCDDADFDKRNGLGNFV